MDRVAAWGHAARDQIAVRLWPRLSTKNGPVSSDGRGSSLIAFVGGMVSLVLLVLPTPALATTLVVDGVERARPWQDLVDRARVPGPTGTVTVHLGACPGYEHARGCTLADGSAIYVKPDPSDGPATLLHELGHVFDQRHMTGGFRARFALIMASDGPWDGPAGVRETFAEAYGLCARRSEVSYPADTVPTDWDYRLYLPTESQHGRACRLIRRVGGGQ